MWSSIFTLNLSKIEVQQVSCRPLDNADKEASLRWLRDGETEEFIHAIQDQVIATNNYKKYIQNFDWSDQWRRCHRSLQTIEHTVNIFHQALILMYNLLRVNEKIPYYDYKQDQFQKIVEIIQIFISVTGLIT